MKQGTFERVRAYCRRKGGVYSFALGWSYDQGSAIKQARRSLAWHTRMIGECQQLPDIIAAHQAQAAAAADLLERLQKGGSDVPDEA
jgi:hypothetical protein